MSDEVQINPIAEARQQLTLMEPQFRAALPTHIPAERFRRVLETVLQTNPALLMKCDRRSLWNAAMRAAQDGLLPDGREGAIVPYKGQAQWMPMIAGLRKKAHNSGEISTWDAHCVYENDDFVYQLGDEPFIRHQPALGKRGAIIAAYSVAKLKDGSLSREVMTIEEIEGIRSKSKAEFGPWNDPIFYPEMARKTVLRRHAKALPMSSDLEVTVERDDEIYDLTAAREAATAERNGGNGKQTLAGKLDNLAALPGPAAQDVADEDEAPAVDTLIAQIKQLTSIEACLEWGLKNSANMGHLPMDDQNSISKALLAQQYVITKQTSKQKEAGQGSAEDPLEIPASLRRTPKNGNGRLVAV
jgi:recombination protein RecT